MADAVLMRKNEEIYIVKTIILKSWWVLSIVTDEHHTREIKQGKVYFYDTTVN